MYRRLRGKKGQDFTWGNVIYIVLGIIIIFIGFTLLPKMFGPVSKANRCPGVCRLQCDNAENPQGFCSEQDIGGIVKGTGALNVCCIPKVMPGGQNPSTGGSARPNPTSPGTFTLSDIPHITSEQCKAGRAINGVAVLGQYCGNAESSRPKLIMTRVCHQWPEKDEPECVATCDYCAKAPSPTGDICEGLTSGKLAEYSCREFSGVEAGKRRETCAAFSAYCSPGYCPQETAYCQRDFPYSLVIKVGDTTFANEQDELADVLKLTSESAVPSGQRSQSGRLVASMKGVYDKKLGLSSVKIEGPAASINQQFTCVAMLWSHDPASNRVIRFPFELNNQYPLPALTASNGFVVVAPCKSWATGFEFKESITKIFDDGKLLRANTELHIGVVDPDACKGPSGAPLTGEALFDCQTNFRFWSRHSRVTVNYYPVPICPETCEQIETAINGNSLGLTLEPTCKDPKLIIDSCALDCAFIPGVAHKDGKNTCMSCSTPLINYCFALNNLGCDASGSYLSTCTSSAGQCFFEPVQFTCLPQQSPPELPP